MELTDLVRALRRHWVAGVIAFAVVMVPALAAALLPEKRYASEATVGVYVNDDPSDAVVSSEIQNLVEDARSRTLVGRVRATLPDAVADTGVGISASAEEFIISLRAESTSPEAAKAWVDAVAAELVKPVEGEATRRAVKDFGQIDGDPVSPLTVQLIIGGVIVGILSAVVSSAVAFRLQAQLDPAELIRTRLGSTVLGELPRPRIARTRRLGGPPDRSWPPGLEEAVRRVATNLEVRMIGRERPAVAFVALESASPTGDVAALVGWTLASGGRQVGLVDADVSRPSLHDRFGFPLRRGLSDVAGEAAPGASGGRIETIHRHQIPVDTRQRSEGRLEVVSAGTGYYRPAEVMSRRLPQVLAEWAETADLLLTVNPPLDESPEAWLAVASTPYAVLIVDHSEIEAARLASVVTRLREQRVELLGVVLTGARARRGLTMRRPRALASIRASARAEPPARVARPQRP